MTEHPLAGQTALVTGVSRRQGIGFAVARRLLELGASVAIQHFRPHDVEQPWGGDDINTLVAELESSCVPGARVSDFSVDLRAADVAPSVITRAVALTGTLDILVCNHAKSGDDGSIMDMNAERLSAMWEVNTRSTMLLTAEFAKLHPLVDGPLQAPVGRVFWMTSGQQDGPMRGEVAYAASKAALAGVTATVAAELLERGIIVNTINPGPVNTGYLDAATTDRDLTDVNEWLARTPYGRFGKPTDPAHLIGWLATDEGAWVVGQVVKSDGGMSLF